MTEECWKAIGKVLPPSVLRHGKTLERLQTDHNYYDGRWKQMGAYAFPCIYILQIRPLSMTVPGWAVVF